MTAWNPRLVPFAGHSWASYCRWSFRSWTLFRMSVLAIQHWQCLLGGSMKILLLDIRMKTSRNRGNADCLFVLVILILSGRSASHTVHFVVNLWAAQCIFRQPMQHCFNAAAVLVWRLQAPEELLPRGFHPATGQEQVNHGESNCQKSPHAWHKRHPCKICQAGFLRTFTSWAVSSSLRPHPGRNRIWQTWTPTSSSRRNSPNDSWRWTMRKTQPLSQFLLKQCTQPKMSNWMEKLLFKDESDEWNELESPLWLSLKMVALGAAAFPVTLAPHGSLWLGEIAFAVRHLSEMLRFAWDWLCFSQIGNTNGICANSHME